MMIYGQQQNALILIIPFFSIATINSMTFMTFFYLNILQAMVCGFPCSYLLKQQYQTSNKMFAYITLLKPSKAIIYSSKIVTFLSLIILDLYSSKCNLWPLTSSPLKPLRFCIRLILAVAEKQHISGQDKKTTQSRPTKLWSTWGACKLKGKKSRAVLIVDFCISFGAFQPNKLIIPSEKKWLWLWTAWQEIIILNCQRKRKTWTTIYTEGLYPCSFFRMSSHYLVN